MINFIVKGYFDTGIDEYASAYFYVEIKESYILINDEEEALLVIVIKEINTDKNQVEKTVVCEKTEKQVKNNIFHAINLLAGQGVSLEELDYLM